mgnify:CR=1 FL=1
MKIAIHNRPGSFSDRWIKYCMVNGLPYKVVDCYDNYIIDKLHDCDILMWHHHHGDLKDVLFSKQLLFSIEQLGKHVFPDFNTNWHFDDKVGQKYLLESANVPMVPSYVFYNKQEAKEWINNTSFPKVFKLRGGAGSTNVKLIKSKLEAERIVKLAFSRGFSQFDKLGNLKERYIKFKEGRDSFSGLLKGLGRLFFITEYAKMKNRERGYVYFQDFVPNNKYDIRIIVIGDRAFGIKRMVRNNDFRASGSGNIFYDKNQIDENCVRIAFNANEKLKSQSIAFDFVFDSNGNPLIVEISYGFDVKAYDFCPGYWDKNMLWHDGKFNPQEWMVQNVVNKLIEKNND